MCNDKSTSPILLFFLFSVAWNNQASFVLGIEGLSKYPEILNDLDLHDRKRPLAHDFWGERSFSFTLDNFYPLRNNHPVHLPDEILEIHKRIAEGFAPFQIVQRILQEVAGLNVAVLADEIQDVLQIKLLLWGEIVTLYPSSGQEIVHKKVGSLSNIL